MNNQYKNALYENIEIPEELDEMINKTILKVNEENQQKPMKKRKYQLIASVVGLSLLVVPLNISPSYASFAGSLPIVGSVAKLLTFREYTFEEEITQGAVKTPVVEGLSDEEFQEKINALINERVEKELELSKERAQEYKDAYIATGGTEESYAERKIKVGVDYEIFSNSDKYLSFLVYSHESLAAVYATYEYYNIDIENNKEMTLEDFFGEQYQSIITKEVKAKVLKEIENDERIYFEDVLQEEWKIRPDMDFYIHENGNIVVVFDKYEIAAGCEGRLAYEIPMPEQS